MLRFRKYLWVFTILFVFFFSTVAESAPPKAARIFGTVTVDGTVLTQDTDEGYELEVTREDGTSYDPAAELTDGLNYFAGYGIYVPLYDADDQPGGANPGDTAVMHVYKDGLELAVTSPASGEFTVGGTLSNHRMDLSVVSLQPYQYTLTINTVGSGIVTLNPAGGTYDEGTVVALTAQAASGWQFSGWSGNLTGSSNPATITMNSHKTVTATFTEVPPSQYTLTINTVGSGIVTLSPAGGTYDEGTVVALTAQAASGWQFSGWSGNLTGSSNPATITMNSHKTVTATFTEVPPSQYTLTINTVGSGIVTLSPAGGTYDEGTVVALTAQAASGWQFSGWSGNLTGSSNPATITMNSHKTVTATFTEVPPSQYTLTINTVGSGIVTLSPAGGTYDEGTVVALTAQAASGWQFSGWSGNLTGSSNPATITMNSHKTVTATFTEVPPSQYTLTINTVGSGSVTLSPAGGTYDEGTVVALTAQAASGWQFSGWSGNLTGSSNPATITMNSHKTVTATFTEVPPSQYTLTINTVGSGIVTLSPAGGTYDEGTVVALTAQAASGWQFSGWSGNLTGSSNPATITMNSHKMVTATFTQQLPVINSFSATPSTISEGEFVTLSWNITGANSATIDNGVGAVVNTSGSAQDAPTITTTYTLTASNPAGTVTRGVTVTVVQVGPVIDSFSASPSTINENESATLSWSISDADSATIDNDIGPIDPESDSREVSPLSTTTYTLTATNDNGSVTRKVTVTVSEPSVPEIVETIPHDGAGINDSTRVSNMTSFCVRIEDPDGIDITDLASIRFTVDDGVVEEYMRGLGDDSVRVIKLTDDADTRVTKLWVAYDRSKEDKLEDYSYDTQVNIKVDVNNREGREMAQESYSIKTETEAEHYEAEAASPKTEPVDVSDPDLDDPEYTYNAGIKVTSGKLKGAKIIYNSNESVKPRFGPTEEVPSLDAESEDIPMNLQPPNVFSTPVKLIIPYRGVSDVTDVCVFLFTGNRWVRACNADGHVEADGEGWMVPGSRVNHNKDKGNPSTIETKVYHFSAVQAGGDGPPDSCFIASSGYGSFSKAFCVKKLERFADMYKMSYLALQTACVQKMLIFSFILVLMAEGFIIVRRSKKYPDYS